MIRRVIGVVTGACALTAAMVAGTAGAAQAHPLGNFTVNRYSGIVIASDSIRVDHVVDFAEVPTVQERTSIDADRNGTTTSAELARYASRSCTTDADRMSLSVDGRAARLSVERSTARLLAGQAGLKTLRLECGLSARTTVGLTTSVHFTDQAAADRIGWREVTAEGDGTRLTGADVPARSVSHRLTAYPSNALSAPLDQRGADLRVRLGGPRLASGPVTDAVIPRPTDRLTAAFAGLVDRPDLSLPFALLALLLATGIGAAHALAPGHGKTVMAFYLAGERARSIRAAATVGVTVTVTHTAGVLLLGVLVSTTVAVAPAAAYPWLGALSGTIVAAVGFNLLREARRGHGHGDGHGHSHGRGHSHGDSRGLAHKDAHAQGHGHGHSHAHQESSDHGYGEEHGQDELHPHDHPHDPDEPLLVPTGVAATPQTTPLVAPLRPDPRSRPHCAHPRDHLHPSVHPHSGVHEQPETVTTPEGNRVPRRGLVAMGLAGGLVPSPTALVVLLGAVAVGRAWFGVLLVVAFGLGMALTLSAVGLAVAHAGHRVARLAPAAQRPRLAWVFSRLPLATAVLVCLLGLVIAARGLLTALG